MNDEMRDENIGFSGSRVSTNDSNEIDNVGNSISTITIL
jgi:hypothetical protein